MLKRKPALKLVPKVDEEFAALIAPLSSEEYQQLEANLLSHGCLDALVVWRGLLVDGHNRLAICNRHGIPYETTEIALEDRESAKLWIEENQIGRRNLTTDQRVALAYRIMQRRVAVSKKQRAAKAGASRGSGPNLVVHVSHQAETTPRQRERTAREHQISTRKIREIAALAKTDPGIVDRIANADISLRDAKEATLERVRQRNVKAALKTHPRGEGIHTGHMSQLFGLLDDDSVDLFITDPPWAKDALPLYAELGRLAQQKLKPGGFCLVLCGQMYLDEIVKGLSESLDWYWLCSVRLLGGAHGRICQRNIANNFKPILMYTKRPGPKVAKNQWIGDMIDRPKADKVHHKHGQAAGDSQYYIEHLTLPGSICVDPFVGGGTIPELCAKTGRRFVGTELDPGTAAAARARVAAMRRNH
jgi:ParB-like chromosome segregation protein Spo0J